MRREERALAKTMWVSAGLRPPERLWGDGEEQDADVGCAVEVFVTARKDFDGRDQKVVVVEGVAARVSL